MGRIKDYRTTNERSNKMTPMQELIKEIDDAKKTVSSLSELKGINKVLFLAEQKLEIEKQVIIDSYYAGTSQFANHAEIERPLSAEDYYNSLTL